MRRFSLFACVLFFSACSPPDESDTIDTASEALTSGVTVNCKAVNKFGYVGSAAGTLSLNSHDWPSGFLVTGTLQINTKLYGQADHKRTITITGDIDATGEYAYLNPKTGAPDIEQLNLVFAPHMTSSINATNTIEYQTDCSSSVVTFPHGSDLALDRTMRFYSRGDGTIGVQLDVTNIGNLAATAATGRVKIGTHTATVSLHQYYGGTSTKANTVNPSEDGYLFAILPQADLARCAQYQVAIDLDHNMQSGSPTPFANDSGVVKTPCLTWETPITEYVVGYAPDPIVQYKTLADIVSSNVVARKSDGKTCNQCHFIGSGHPYSPPSGDIRSGQNIDGLTWAQGWAQEFVAQPIKPDYLKQLFKQWIQDGAK